MKRLLAILRAIYHRLTRADRLERVEAELHNQTAAVQHHSNAIVDYGAELRARLDELHGHLAETNERMRSVVAGQWDQQAMVRRIAALEDRLEQLAAQQASDAGGRAPDAG